MHAPLLLLAVTLLSSFVGSCVINAFRTEDNSHSHRQQHCTACGSISGHCTRVMCTRHTKRCLFTFYILICYRCYETMFAAETVIRIAMPLYKRVMKSQTAKMMMANMSTNIYFTCVFTTPKFVPCLRLICDYVNENRRWTMGDAEASKYFRTYFVIMASRLRIHCSK